MDARLPDGVRLHAVLPPVSPGGTCLSLRLARNRVVTLDELVAAGSMPPDGAAVLSALVASRQAFLVTGTADAAARSVHSTWHGIGKAIAGSTPPSVVA